MTLSPLLRAYDQAILGRFALRNPLLAKIVRTWRKAFPTYGKAYVNHNKMLSWYPGTVGLKTGWTTAAGGCLATAVQRRGRTVIAVYAISGFCSALGGVLLSFYMLSGNSLHAVGMELDAIAAVVIGGTLLTGGAGTIAGVLLLGVIQNMINQVGNVQSSYQQVISGASLAIVVVAQTYLTKFRRVT